MNPVEVSIYNGDRNATSVKHIVVDRDVLANNMQEQQLLARLNNLRPGEHVMLDHGISLLTPDLLAVMHSDPNGPCPYLDTSYFVQILMKLIHK